MADTAVRAKRFFCYYICRPIRLHFPRDDAVTAVLLSHPLLRRPFCLRLTKIIFKFLLCSLSQFHYYVCFLKFLLCHPHRIYLFIKYPFVTSFLGLRRFLNKSLIIIRIILTSNLSCKYCSFYSGINNSYVTRYIAMTGR
jgi:hypothetical protein